MDIVQEIKTRISPGTIIPKPETDAHIVIGWGERNGKEALVYQIPNNNKPAKPNKKKITVEEWYQAYERIHSGEDFTSEWFNHEMHDCAKQGSCNFTTIGGIFELLGFATYRGNGIYSYRPNHS